MEWISVEDRVPETTETVLVCVREGGWARRAVARYLDEKWPCHQTVTHWMPLPEVPKVKPRRQWDFYVDDKGYYRLYRDCAAIVTARGLCDALNGTAQSLLEFAGVECECGCKEGPWFYKLMGNAHAISRENPSGVTITVTSYIIKNEKGELFSAEMVCKLLNQHCHSGCQEEERTKPRGQQKEAEIN